MRKETPIDWLDEYLLDKHHEEKEKILKSGECKSVSEIRLMMVKKAIILFGLSIPLLAPFAYFLYQDIKILNDLGAHSIDSSKEERILGLVKFSIIFTVFGLPLCGIILNEIISGNYSILNFLTIGSAALTLSGSYYVLIKENYFQNNDDGKRRERKSISETVREKFAWVLEGEDPVGEQALISIPVKYLDPSITQKT